MDPRLATPGGFVLVPGSGDCEMIDIYSSECEGRSTGGRGWWLVGAAESPRRIILKSRLKTKGAISMQMLQPHFLAKRTQRVQRPPHVFMARRIGPSFTFTLGPEDGL